MPETGETIVTAEQPPKGRNAFTAARASVKTPEPEPAPAPDDTPPPPTPPAEHTEKVADQPPEPTDDQNALLTPEELAALPPKQRANAEKWQAKLTKRAQDLSAQAKEFDDWKPLMTALRDNPDAAIEELAKRRGLTVAKAPTQDTRTVEATTAETIKELPEEWQFLAPVFDAFGKRLLESVRGEIAPLQARQDALISDAVAAETEATIKGFEAKYPGWTKFEPKMLELGKKFVPAAGAMTDFEYMETLYKLATADVADAEKTKTVVARINKSAEAAEPAVGGLPDKSVDQVMPDTVRAMDSSARLRAAHEAAKRGVRWTK